MNKDLLVRRRGVGTQVVHGAVARQIELTSLYDDIKRSGGVPSTRVLDSTRVPVSAAAAEHLGVTRNTEVLRLRRLRLALAVLENYLPSRFKDLSAGTLVDSGLYRELRARGVTLRVARQRIGARRATNDEAQLLGIGRGAPVLTMDRTAYDADGAALPRHILRTSLIPILSRSARELTASEAELPG